MARPTAFVVLALLVSAGCGKDGPNPTQPSAQQPLPLKLRIEGTTNFAGPGERAQLVAIGTYADGDRPITSGAIWEVNRAAVATVDAAGVLNTTGLGVASIRLRHLDVPVAALLTITVTPPGTQAVAGRVREPGGGPMTSVLVEESGSGLRTMTDPNGDFTLGGLTAGQLSFSKSGYEPVSGKLPARSDDGMDVPMQKVLTASSGNTLSSILAPNDLSYDVAPGVSCGLCRLVHVTSTGTGTVTLRLKWASVTKLSLWVNGQEFTTSAQASSEVTVDAPVQPGDQVVYVAATTLQQHTSWTLAVSEIR